MTLADGGAATVAWTQFRDATPTATQQVLAAVSSPAGAWGPAELVSDGPASTLTATYAPGERVPTVLFDTFRAATSDRVLQAASVDGVRSNTSFAMTPALRGRRIDLLPTKQGDSDDGR